MTSLSLYELEDTYVALLDTEAMVTPESEAEFKAVLAAALKSTVGKRDKVGQFIAHVRGLEKTSKAEKERLAKRESFYAGVADRMESYVLAIIESKGQDEKGKYPKLEGNTVTFSARANPPSVEITDIEAIPSEYKTLTFSVPAVEWEKHVRLIQMLFDYGDGSGTRILNDISNPSVTPDKAALAKALKAGVMVPGADLKTESYRLEVK